MRHSVIIETVIIASNAKRMLAQGAGTRSRPTTATSIDTAGLLSGSATAQTLLSSSWFDLYRSDSDGIFESFHFNGYLRGMYYDHVDNRVLVLGDFSGNQGAVLTMENATVGTPALELLSITPRFYIDITRVGDTYYVSRTGGLYTLDLSDPQNPAETLVGDMGIAGTSGLSYDPTTDTLYLLAHSTDTFYAVNRENANLQAIGSTGMDFSDTDLEWFDGHMYAAVQNSTSGRIEIGEISLRSGLYSAHYDIAPEIFGEAAGLAIVPIPEPATGILFLSVLVAARRR